MRGRFVKPVALEQNQIQPKLSPTALSISPPRVAKSAREVRTEQSEKN